MYLGEPPSFEEVLVTLSTLEIRLNETLSV
jgi:hypothetical protein